MERFSSEIGSGSMEDPKKREYSWSVMNCIQRGQSTEGDLAFRRERITGKLLRLGWVLMKKKQKVCKKVL